MRPVPLAVAGVLLVCVVSACGSSAEESVADPAALMVNEGSWYSRQVWPHDGNPYESRRFVVYSDGASAAARREAADVAEEIWSELLDDFDVESGMLQFPPDQDKIDIYAYKDYYPEAWGMRAYYAGVIMWSPDHKRRSTSVADYGPVLRHELVHVLESLLRGREFGAGEMTDDWFSEGLAEAIAGGTAGGAIRDSRQLDALIAEYGAVSPVSVKRPRRATVPLEGFYYDYPMYQLAVEYLLSDHGPASTLTDVRILLTEMRDGSSFREAFDDTMGIELDTYDQRFFELMDGYLPEYRNALFSPAGYLLFSVMVTGAVVAIVALGYRYWRTPIAAGNRPAPGRAATVAFGGETLMALGIAVAFFLGLFFIIGTVRDFNNAMEANTRTNAYGILVGGLVLSVGVILWAIHRWFRHSRAAFLVAPLVIVVTAAAFVTIAVTT
jgi:hypothetical protein